LGRFDSAQAEYQVWLNEHKQIAVKPAGDDQWKNLSFDDGIAASTRFDDSSWQVMSLPGLFERSIGEFDGAVWFRKTVALPPEFKGKDLVLSLGPIDDMDFVYFNGELVGSTEVGGYWQVNRNYDIPGKLVNEGPNTIAVRVLDTQGGGGI
jgi:sialate O-acetylesterase